MARRRPRSIARALAQGDTTAAFVVLRDALARQLDALQVVHDPECTCQCGDPVGDVRTIVQVARELADLVEQIERRAEKPKEQVIGDELSKRRAARRATG